MSRLSDPARLTVGQIADAISYIDRYMAGLHHMPEPIKANVAAYQSLCDRITATLGISMSVMRGMTAGLMAITEQSLDGVRATPLTEALAVLNARSPRAETDQGWLTVTDAATIAGTDRGSISRAVNYARLKSNGKVGHDRRIDAVDLTRWMLERSKRDVPEDEEKIKKRLRDAGLNAD
jgi:hypothetical protein